MISIIRYLQESEFATVTNDMAFDAAKRIAKSRVADQYDPEDYLYKIKETVKSKSIPITSEGLTDKDKLGVWSGRGPASNSGKIGYDLLKKRFKRE